MFGIVRDALLQRCTVALWQQAAAIVVKFITPAYIHRHLTAFLYALHAFLISLNLPCNNENNVEAWRFVTMLSSLRAVMHARHDRCMIPDHRKRFIKKKVYGPVLT